MVDLEKLLNLLKQQNRNLFRILTFFLASALMKKLITKSLMKYYIYNIRKTTSE